MDERSRVNKSWTSLNFTFKLHTFLSCLYLIYASKIYVRVHACKNYVTVEIHSNARFNLTNNLLA